MSHYDDLLKEAMELMKRQNSAFIERAKKNGNSGKPKYTYGDYVEFDIGNTTKEGSIEIIDAFGTCEQNEEPSYDILNVKENTLYKHIRESWITRFLRKATKEERWD